MKIHTRVFLAILGIVILMFASIIGTVSVLSKNKAEEEAKKITASFAKEQANSISNELQTPLNAAHSLAATFESMVKTGNYSPATYDVILKNMTEKHGTFLGTWIVTEPNVFGDKTVQTAYSQAYDKTGRFVSFWARNGNGIERAGVENTENMKEGTHDFYMLPKKTGKETIMDPYMYEINGKNVLMTSLIVPLTINDTFVGVIGVDLSLDYFQEMNSKIKLYDSGFGVILSNNATFVAHPTKENIGKNVTELKGLQNVEQLKNAVKTGTAYTILDYSPTTKSELYKVTEPIAVGSTATPWSYVIAVPLNEVLASANGMMLLSLSMALIGTIILAILLHFIVRAVVRPITTAASYCKQMADGDFTFEVPERDLVRKDEVGELAVSLIGIKENMKAMIERMKDHATTVSASAAQLQRSTDQGVHAADEIVRAVQEVASGSIVQEQSADESARAMEEMALGIQRVAEASSSIAEASSDITNQVRTSNGSVQQAIRQMESIRTVTDETASAIQTLQRDSEEAGGILQLITEVSAQTNLLALNAAIEAARAGEAGRGFAVVADEIRKLADQTGSSAAKIQALIEQIQSNTAQAVHSMEESKMNVGDGIATIHQVGSIFEQIMTAIESITSQIQEMSAVSEEMSASTEQVSASVEEMARIAKESAASTKQVAASSQGQLANMNDMRQAAASLSSMAQALEVLIHEFKVVK
ncbi:methyl-accepting chemotaxis protein [Aneurinibacillus sp. REN35]|uniref:methyl-accepting chemotaxis protein n=1 Tax=Aneurinibacillus sp. REN35 TaxID=3237286 RepID=UPI0035281697